MTHAIYPNGLTMRWDNEHWFPFIEDENGNITGPGHMDKAAFARLVSQFDSIAWGEPVADENRYAPEQVSHKWAVYDEEHELFVITGVTQNTPEAYAITTLWNVR